MSLPIASKIPLYQIVPSLQDWLPLLPGWWDCFEGGAVRICLQDAEELPLVTLLLAAGNRVYLEKPQRVGHRWLVLTVESAENSNRTTKLRYWGTG